MATEADPKSGQPELVPWTLGDEKPRWSSLNGLLGRSSASFAPPTFEGSPEVSEKNQKSALEPNNKPTQNASKQNLEILQEDFRVLVVGAGGLGCEVLKNLALSGFKDIHVIDLDEIDLSNLNRQFLFRQKDVGQPKAKVAAEFIMKRVPGCVVQWHNKPIQDFDTSYYTQFNVIVAGLDNVEARRWLNATLYDLVKVDENGNPDPESIIPFVDGGTEGFLGQARLFVPRMGSCFECSVGTIAQDRPVHSCTIASIPRRPEHCIEYAQKILWPRLRSLNTTSEFDMAPLEEDVPDPNGVNFDSDNVHHMSWIFRQAEIRAQQYNITGVTYNLTMQVVKNIIPAIASTNALVSAACVSEAMKVLTWASFGLNNYFMYMGQDGIYTRTFNFEKNPQCLVCGVDPVLYRLDPSTPFKNLYDKLCRDPVLKLKDPSVSVDGQPLFMAGKYLRKAYEKNMEKPISELMESGHNLSVTSKVLGKKAATIQMEFVEGEFYEIPIDE